MIKTIARVACGSAAAVALALTGVSAAGASVTHVRPANTGSCGLNCVEVSLLTPGFQWVQTDHLGKKAIGVNGTIQYLQYRTSTNPRQDYLPINVGTAADYCPKNAFTGGNGADPVLNANLCLQLVNNGYVLADIQTEQLEYTPYGVDSGDCTGVSEAGALSQNEPVRLQACNDNRRTFWLIVPVPAPGFLALNGGSSGTINAYTAAADNGSPALQELVIKRTDVDTNGIFDSTELVDIEPGL